MAKEHGMMEHKGKTIPKEVKSLADRIRKEQPDKSDEYAYRTAWDIFRSETPEGKQYPHKSPESGLKREGGGTGPITKESSLQWAQNAFWQGFMKQAVVKIPNFLSKLPKAELPKIAPSSAEMPRLPSILPKAVAKNAPPQGVPRMSDAVKVQQAAAKPKPKPGPALDYKAMNTPTRPPEGSEAVLSYGSKGFEKYTPAKS